MALYVPQARRRRRVLLIAAATLVVGLVLGAILGRVSAPTVDDRVADVHSRAKDIAASLGVVSTHIEDTTVGAGGTDTALQHAGESMEANFRDAPWLSPEQEQILRDTLTGLKNTAQKNTKEFAARIDAFITMVEDLFNGRPIDTPAPSPTPTPTPTPSPAASPDSSPSASPSGSPSAEPSATPPS
jgi:hypothetical protein